MDQLSRKDVVNKVMTSILNQLHSNFPNVTNVDISSIAAEFNLTYSEKTGSAGQNEVADSKILNESFKVLFFSCFNWLVHAGFIHLTSGRSAFLTERGARLMKCLPVVLGGSEEAVYDSSMDWVGDTKT